MIHSSLGERSQLPSRMPFAVPLIAALMIAGTASADFSGASFFHPGLQRGETSAARFHEDGASKINLLTGNLLFKVPLGSRYPVDSRLRYGFELSYNSQIWDFQTSPGAAALPIAASNAGLGFDLSFGRLLAPNTARNESTRWVYVAPDGSAHPFYADLHWDTPDTQDPSNSTSYTRDGSYLRLRSISPSLKHLDLPDGTSQRLEPIGSEWRVTRHTSPVGGQWIAISYGTNDLNWTLTDSHGRSHLATFVIDPASNGRRLLTQLDLAAFDGSVATYTLTYQQQPIALPCSEGPGTVTVSTLQTLTDPTGFVRSFSVHAAASGCEQSGRLATAQRVTGGIDAWDYGFYPLGNPTCEDGAPAFLEQVSGVVAARHVHPSSQIVASWNFAPETTASSGTSCSLDERRTRVSTPLGHQSVYYFSVGGSGSSAGEGANFGLPGSDLQLDLTNALPSQRLALSLEVFDCSAGCQLMRSEWQAWDQDEQCTAPGEDCFQTQRRLERKRIVFHDDEDRFRDLRYSNFDGLGNYRVSSKQSNFGQADSLIKTRHFNTDAGAYPPTPSGPGPAGGTLSFQVPAPTASWVLTDATYDEIVDHTGHRLRRDYCYDSEGQLLRMRRRGNALSAADLLEVYSYGGGHRLEQAFFGGDLQPLQLTADLCALSLPAEPTHRRAYGFQFGVASSREWLNSDSTSVGFLELDRDIDPGTGLVARERTVAGLETIFDYDATGRLTWHKRPQGSWKEFRYFQPNLNAPGGWAGEKTLIFERPNGQTAGVFLSRQVQQFNAFGGLFVEQEWITPTSSRRRVHLYDGENNRTHESMWHQPGESYVNRLWLDFDPFGRFRTLRPADGVSHERQFTYQGVRASEEISPAEWSYNAATEQCHETDMVTTRLFDGQGRQWKMSVSRPLPLPGEIAAEEVHFLSDGRRRSLRQTRHVGESSRVLLIDRAFDGRGLLISESTYSGDTNSLRMTETHSYGEFDGRGEALVETRVGDRYPGAGISTRFTYDAASRLTQVADASGAGRVWKEFLYGQANGPADASGRVDYRLGQLVESRRHNYVDLLATAHHTVSEASVYRGLDGRRSTMTLDVSTVSSSSGEFNVERSWTTSAEYDSLGRIEQRIYPSCLECSAGEPTGERRIVQSFDLLGRLKTVTGSLDGSPQNWLDSVTWASWDMPTELAHSNGVHVIASPDPSGLARPSSVTVQRGLNNLYASGLMAYDGRGELCGHGERSMASAPDELAQSSVPSTCDTALDFDPFGLWSGEYNAAECLPQNIDPYFLYDAHDRLIGGIDLRATSKVYVNGIPEWVLDPDRFELTWRLFGVDNYLLREVSDHYLGDWQETVDSIYGPVGREIGKARQRAAAGPGAYDELHFHPRMSKATNALGFPVFPWP